ncbi:MAG: tetratricopeptide repeat protein [Actinobacteria bacterium]|nr:tetratricopeptide repeat protein [Actinomycetota bacterium]
MSALLTGVGLYLRARADYPSARDAFERALALDESRHGLESSCVARDLENLGWVLKDLAQSPRAQKLFERALRTCFTTRVGSAGR